MYTLDGRPEHFIDHFYVEGVATSTAPQDVTVRMTYVYVGACGLPLAAAVDGFKVSVTPFVTSNTIEINNNAAFNSFDLNPPI